MRILTVIPSDLAANHSIDRKASYYFN